MYYRAETKELVTIRGEADELSGSGWQLVTEDTGSGLVTARALFVERGLVDEQGATGAYWYFAQPKKDERELPGQKAA